MVIELSEWFYHMDTYFEWLNVSAQLSDLGKGDHQCFVVFIVHFMRKYDWLTHPAVYRQNDTAAIVYVVINMFHDI